MKLSRQILWICAAMTLLSLSCTREIVDAGPQEDSGQVLHISFDGGFTFKSSLTNSGASQHIEHMYAYLFRESSEGDGDFRCFHAVDLDWVPVDGTGVSDFTYRISRDAGLQAMGSQQIKVLVVAVDNHPETYSFPVADGGSHVDGVVGLSFDETKARLASAAAGADGETGTPEAKAWAMAHTELLSGVAESVPANAPVIEVTVDRCVAGVLCYLTDIPYLVGTGDEDSKIQSIELRLDSDLDLNTAMTLGNETSGSVPLHADGSVKPADGVVIASADVSMYSERQGMLGQAGSLLYIPATDDGVVRTLENSILFGAYMVPVEVAESIDDQADNSTLSICLTGGADNKKVYHVRNASGTSSQPGVTSDNRSYSYSIQANRLYAIGVKPTSGDTEGDRPASLAGDEILLNVTDWVDVPVNDIDAEFPQYAPGACFDPDFEEGYIFDCIGTGTDRLINVTILPALDKESEWTLDVECTEPEHPDAVADDGDWLLYRFITGGTDENPVYSDWYSGETFHSSQLADLGLDPSSEIRMQIALADYVEINMIMYGADNCYPGIEDKIAALQNDYRTATFRLSTGGRIDEMKINQYNAITSPVYDDLIWLLNDFINEDQDIEKYVGFARYDLLRPDWDNTDNEDGDGYSYAGWGFEDVPLGPDYIYGNVIIDKFRDGGMQNSISAKAENHSEYDNSAIRRGTTAWTCIEANEVSDGGGGCWFLPAETELFGFFYQVVAKLNEYYGNNHSDSYVIPVANIKFNQYYWSSSLYWLDEMRYSVAAKISGQEINDEMDIMSYDRDDRPERSDPAYIRQAREFK